MFAMGRDDMRRMDHYSNETLGLPGAILMENAGMKVVDALLGTGCTGNVREPIRSAIELINTSRNKVVSVDIPSGVDSDTGEVADIAVRADHTINIIEGSRRLLNDWTVKY